MKSRIIPDIVQDQTICALPETSTVDEAARQMADCNVAAVVVIDDHDSLVGIVTERDITRRLVGQGRNPKTTRLGEIMTHDPDTLAPNDTAKDALERMCTRGFRHLPVMEDGEVVGMVSIRDLYAKVLKAIEDDLHETEAYVFGDRYGMESKTPAP